MGYGNRKQVGELGRSCLKSSLQEARAAGERSWASYPIKSPSSASVSPLNLESDLEGEDFRAAAGLQA